MFALLSTFDQATRKRLRDGFDPFDRYALNERATAHGCAFHASLAHGLTSPGPVHVGEDGSICVFDGWLDNLADLANSLNCEPKSSALVYRGAVDRWGLRAEEHILGKFAAAILYPDGSMRLSRSTIEARPLSFARIGDANVAASLPRLLLAAGLPANLSERGIADALYLNVASGNGWYEGSWRLDPGDVVELAPDGEFRRHRNAVPIIRPVPKGTEDEWVAEADRLLREATGAALDGASRPGILLSGGLDSSNLAARAVDALPRGERLPTFTFLPASDWQGEAPPRQYASERAKVEGFCASHAALVPTFVASDTRALDADWDAVFAAIGCAPPGLVNVGPYHGLFAAARDAGCDLLLSAETGNLSISIAGEWAAAEYLRNGRLRQSWSAAQQGEAPSIRKWLRHAVAAQLPDRAWRIWQQIKGNRATSAQDRIAPISIEARESHDLRSRAIAGGSYHLRQFPASRAAWLADNFRRGDMGAGEVELAFEQIYGIRQRDVCAYRPLVEFCLSLPTRMFVTDGEDRRLARALGRGMMPEEQRLDRRAGAHQPDWHHRLTPLIPQWQDEFAAMSARKELRALFDFDEIAARIGDWPASERQDDEALYRYAMGVPIAMMTMRFVRRVQGWNTP